MDFIDSQFDNPEVYSGPTAEVMVLSTPRSGATAVCNLLHNNGVGTPHAYFQPFQYLPAIARRVGLKDVNSENLHRVTAFLRTRRSRGGWFAYNIHASHHDIWRAFRSSLDAAGMSDGSVLLYCRRADLLSQTASYYIAHRTQQSDNLNAHLDTAQVLDTFDEALAVRLHSSLRKQSQAAEEIFNRERRRFHAVRIINFEDTWSRRAQSIAEVLPIHNTRHTAPIGDSHFRTEVLEQLRQSVALRQLGAVA
jgi:LPS sulfotransferase NodH